MDKRYQVFVSSTYADLQEERQGVIQTLMEMDCIPAGMELFPAADLEQWEFIKRVIADCDYYLLIIGGRYGSTTEEGISFTEKEYDFAVELGLKVVALVHGSPGEIPVAKSETVPSLQRALVEFREKVCSNRLVKFWQSASELPGLVALSLNKTIKTYPAVGWVRGDTVADPSVLAELSKLRDENVELEARIANFDDQSVSTPTDIAHLDEEYDFSGQHNVGARTYEWSVSLSWQDAFNTVAPYLAMPKNQEAVKNLLTPELYSRSGNSGDYPSLEDQDFQTFAIQMQALGLISREIGTTAKGTQALFWSLTSRGQSLMTDLRVVKTAK